MVQNTMRACPGNLSGGQSTIAEYSERSRGIIGLAMTYVYLVLQTGRMSCRRGHAQPNHKCQSRRCGKNSQPLIPAKAGIQAATPELVALGPRFRGDERKSC